MGTVQLGLASGPGEAEEEGKFPGGAHVSGSVWTSGRASEFFNFFSWNLIIYFLKKIVFKEIGRLVMLIHFF